MASMFSVRDCRDATEAVSRLEMLCWVVLVVGVWLDFWLLRELTEKESAAPVFRDEIEFLPDCESLSFATSLCERLSVATLGARLLRPGDFPFFPGDINDLWTSLIPCFWAKSRMDCCKDGKHSELSSPKSE